MRFSTIGGLLDFTDPSREISLKRSAHRSNFTGGFFNRSSTRSRFEIVYDERRPPKWLATKRKGVDARAKPGHDEPVSGAAAQISPSYDGDERP
jgi:hypothetical protein